MIKNRVLDLCIKNGIETSFQFARLTGCSEQKALDIWMQKCIIPLEVLKRCVVLFNEPAAYICCLV